MKCPFCSSIENKVIDSRMSKDGNIIRRRRECFSCQRRFTTHERVEEISPVVIKKDGRREPFDRAKIFAGIQRACEKRPVSIEVIDNLVEKIERDFQEKGEKEIKSTEIGARVMQELHNLDEVAYVRFASVYRQFKDISEFMAEVRELLSTKTKNSPS
jgi:transcriptional repressor NrdR